MNQFAMSPNYANNLINLMRQLQDTMPGSFVDFRSGYQPGSTAARYRGVQFRIKHNGKWSYMTISEAKKVIAAKTLMSA